ncbi:MAG: hypothetical protein Q4Q23_03715 [Methanobacteriaceae archaeon]|nr:hypothetical protein [Methanobacteriaceae archaeon]
MMIRIAKEELENYIKIKRLFKKNKIKKLHKKTTYLNNDIDLNEIDILSLLTITSIMILFLVSIYYIKCTGNI